MALVDNDFKKIKLADFAGKYLVLFFYPLDFTFVCPTEILAYSDATPEFQKIGCNLVACSVDSEYSHFAYTETPRSKGGLGRVNFPMLSDITKKIARDYGCLIESGDESGLSLRATFIIDARGVLRHATYSDTPVGRSVEETLRLVKAFQYSDVHGQVCPAGWISVPDF